MINVKRLKYACAYLKRHKFNHNDKRNLRLGGVVSAYGISFALEKLFIVLSFPLPDIIWLTFYGLFAILSTIWWVEDALLDLWEENTTEDEQLDKEENNHVA